MWLMSTGKVCAKEVGTVFVLDVMLKTFDNSSHISVLSRNMSEVFLCIEIPFAIKEQ